jgi:PhoD-like phosphatase
LGNAIACITRWLTNGLLVHHWAWLWGRAGCENNSILGEEQWTWLEEQLLLPSQDDSAIIVEPDVILILSSIQVWSTNPAMEGWGHFPTEQKRLFHLLERHYEKSTAPVIFLSGDVHHAEILGQSGYLEVTSSGMTHHCGQPTLYGGLCRPLLEAFHAHRYTRQAYFIGHNYGTVQIDWRRRFVSIQVHDARGDVVLQVEQALDGSQVMLPSFDTLPPTMDGHLIPYARRIVWTLVVATILSMTMLIVVSRQRYKL